MKITVNIDCTPEEARTFFGLPDVQPMQEAMLKEVQGRLAANLRAMDPETMLKTWLPVAIKSFEQWQEMLREQTASPGEAKK